MNTVAKIISHRRLQDPMLTNLSVPHDLCFCMRQPNFTSRVGAFSVIVKSLRRFVASSRVPSAVCSGCRVVVFVFDPLIRCVISARVSRPAQPAQPAQPAPGNQNTENNSFVRPAPQMWANTSFDSISSKL